MMHTLRTRVNEDTFNALCEMTDDSSTLAATVRSALMAYVAGEVKPATGGIPDDGCECHDPTHVMCWATAPNPDCHCCQHTLRVIAEQRQAAPVPVPATVKVKLPRPTDDQWRRLNQWIDATGKVPGPQDLITTRSALMAWACERGFQA